MVEARDMAIVIKAHLEGKAVVPDEPLDLPINQPIEVEFRVADDRLSDEEIKRRLAAWKRLGSRAVKANIPAEALRRENMYEPPRGL
jgi:hypothetical protein